MEVRKTGLCGSLSKRKGGELAVVCCSPEGAGGVAAAGVELRRLEGEGFQLAVSLEPFRAEIGLLNHNGRRFNYFLGKCMEGYKHFWIWCISKF